MKRAAIVVVAECDSRELEAVADGVRRWLELA
jgi:hypothetical protein